MDVRSLVISGLRWSAGAKLGGQLVSWASTIVVMRLLNPNDYGLMAMAWVFIFFCRLLNELGLGSAVVQAKELSEHQLRQVFGLVILFNVILTGLLIAASPAIAWFFDEQRLVNMVIVLALQLPVMALAVVPEAVLVREMNFRAPAVVSVASDVTAAVIALALAFLGFGVWTLVLSNLAGVFTRTIGFNIASPYLKRPSFRFTEFAAMAKFGGYVTANRILWYVYSKSDTFIVGKMMGKTLLGYYSVALELASLPLAKVGSIVNQVALPAYSRIQDDRTKVRNYALKAARTIATVAFPVFFGISAVAPEAIELILNDKWLPAIFPLQVLSLVVPLRAFNLCLLPAVSGMGRPDVNTRNLVVACIVMPLSFFLGARWGLQGLSIAWVAGYTTWFLYMLISISPIINITVLTFTRTVIGPAVLSAVMYGSVYATRIAAKSLHLGLAPTLAALILVGAIVYVGTMMLFYRSTLTEIWELRRA